jgi:perosamine synthetase
VNYSYKKIVTFIRELYKKPTGLIPLHTPTFVGNERKYLNECINTTYVSSVGEFVDRFETEIAKFTRAKKAIACVNGTSSLHLALKLAGVERETEVITQPLTFIATVNAITYCGAYPIFIDVDQDTLGLSPGALKAFLDLECEIHDTGCYNKTTHRKINAVLPMHTFGYPCRIDEIVEICNQYKIKVVEDAAESFGSFYKAKHTGNFGEIGVLSFNGNKIITTGGGGMLLFKDEALAKRAKHLTTQAKIAHPWEFSHDEIGYNYRLPNINAALGLAQLEQIEIFLASKKALAEKYRHFFAATDIQYITEPQNASSNFWLNCILLHDRKERDEFLKFTNDNGIMTRPAWTLMNELPMYKNCPAFELRNATNIANTLVNLPSSVINEK